MAKQLYRIYSPNNEIHFEVGVPAPIFTDEQKCEAFRAEEKKRVCLLQHYEFTV